MGRYTATKALVVIAIEVHSPKGFGRVRLRQVPDASAASLTPFVQGVVAPGSVVVTDGWSGYNGLAGLGYEHLRRVQSRSSDPAHVVLPGPHRIASLLKRWLLGTHKGAVSREHLDYYLDEYTFRLQPPLLAGKGPPVPPPDGTGGAYHPCPVWPHSGRRGGAAGHSRRVTRAKGIPRIPQYFPFPPGQVPLLQ